MNSDGFLNMLKPPGMSSHDVVNVVRKILHQKKVGHAGTLDPAAAGVLPIAVGRATKFIEYLTAVDKTYRAEIRLGVATDSGDDTGKVTEEVFDFKMPTIDEIQSVLRRFIGTVSQIPPARSAIKINGQKAYDLLRKNKTVALTQREVTIYRLDLLRVTDNGFVIDVDCSKGTYIRSLAVDIGRALGLPATVSFLLRSRVGDFSLTNALTLEEIQTRSSENTLMLQSPDTYLSHIERYDLVAHRAAAFANGLPTTDFRLGGESRLVAVYSGDIFFGVGNYDGVSHLVSPHKLYASLSEIQANTQQFVP